MGAELGELFDALHNELVWIHWRWMQHRVLFGSKPGRVDLLNESAPFFFRLVQDVFFEFTLLGISKIAGPTKSAGKPNLTVARLPGMLSDPRLAEQTSKLVDDATTACAFAKDWRNRRIAHHDLSLALNPRAEPLAHASRAKVEDALGSIRSVMNHVQSALMNSTTAYDHSPVLSEMDQVLYVLRDGLERDRERRARWDKGEWSESDDPGPV